MQGAPAACHLSICIPQRQVPATTPLSETVGWASQSAFMLHLDPLAGDPRLAPMQAGAWLGKPNQVRCVTVWPAMARCHQDLLGTAQRPLPTHPPPGLPRSATRARSAISSSPTTAPRFAGAGTSAPARCCAWDARRACVRLAAPARATALSAGPSPPRGAAPGCAPQVIRPLCRAPHWPPPAPLPPGLCGSIMWRT